MPVLDVEQQSVFGDLFSIITFPFRVLFKAVVWILTLILKIILFPFKVIKSVLTWIWDHRPEFYFENLFHSFKGLLCFFGIVFIALTAMLVVLIPLHIIPLTAAQRIMKNFDLLHAWTVMGKTFLVTEGAFIGLAVGGFLAALLLVFVLITLYSSLQGFVELTGELTERWIKLVVMFFVAVTIFTVLYLILQGIIPI